VLVVNKEEVLRIMSKLLEQDCPKVMVNDEATKEKYWLYFLINK